MTMLWWHWLVLGLVLALAEMATTGGFYLIFFGLGALLVGLLAAFAVAGPIPVQFLLFSVLSVASLLLFRSRLLRAMQREPQSPAIDTLIGEIGSAVDPLTPGQVGRVELRGTVWSARNAATVVLAAGARCRVVSVDGLLLHVEPEGVRS
jgi:membrane protein implicated in regulation of membrane protease activity